MADPLKTGAAALLAMQRAIATTSHNIANSATEGYTRQRVELAARPAVRVNHGFVGQGVSVESIHRQEDKFAQRQLTLTGSELARVSEMHDRAAQLDRILGDAGPPLTAAVGGFFTAVSDANNDPTNLAARESALAGAENLVASVRSLSTSFESLTGDYLGSLSESVSEINSLAARIAEINQVLASGSASNGKHLPNDLIDQRDTLINRLADEVGISTVDADNGVRNVFLAHGQSLITGGSARELKVMDANTTHDQIPIGFVEKDTVQAIGRYLNGGKLGGLIEYKTTVLDPSIQALGRMAFVITDAVNAQHSKGIDLQGAAGQPLFASITPHVEAAVSNSGAATLVAEVSDVAQLKLTDYSLSYDGTGYTLRNSTNSSSVSGNSPLSLEGITVLINGNMAVGDSFIIAPVKYAARQMAVELRDAEAMALGSPITAASAMLNNGNSSISGISVDDSTHSHFDTPVSIVFNDPPSTYNVLDQATGTTILSNIDYSTNKQVSLNGWTATIEGSPQASDTHTVSRNIDGVANNANGLLLAEIMQKPLLDNHSSLADGFASLISNVGSRTHQAELSVQAMQGMHDAALAKRDNVSGVNLDEEAIDLARYQQAYQAAAQVINTADQMFQSLLGALR